MLELDNATFQEVIKSDTPVVVDFWANWCMPCKIFAPVLEELSDEYDGKAQFCKVNIDDCMELAEQYAVTSIPTVIIFKNGDPEVRMIGVRPKQEVLEALKQHL